MPAFVVARLVTDHAGQLVVGLHEVDRALVDVDVAAADRERVDVLCVEDLDVVGHVLAGGFGPERLSDFVDPLVEQRIRHDVVLLQHLLVDLFRLRDFGRRGGRRCGRGNARGQHRENEPGRDHTTKQHALNLGVRGSRRPFAGAGADTRQSGRAGEPRVHSRVSKRRYL